MTEKELKYIAPLENIQKFLSSADHKSKVTQSYFDDEQVTEIIKQFEMQLPEKVSHASARVRKEEIPDLVSYVLCVKGKIEGAETSDRFEDELELEAEDYERLEKEAKNGTIIKTRYYFIVGIDAYPAELTVDIFHFIGGKKQEWKYAMIEVEYDDDGMKEALRDGKHDLEILQSATEVTGDKQFTNKALAQKLPS
ncbi:MAG: hypothetical protein PHU71_02620 [Candidatus Gracilibacteria bacterium]|nr:hypothetical protein [Candidatus Gracilibacteria bacterium]